VCACVCVACLSCVCACGVAKCSAARRDAQLTEGWLLPVLLLKAGEHTVYVKRRKGFLRYALQYNVPVVPVYAFGETDMYHTSSFLLPLRMWLVKTCQLALPLFWGRFPWPMWRRVKFTYAVGAPISPPSVDVDSVGQAIDRGDPRIEEFHKLYVEGLTAAFDAVKATAGCPDAMLQVE